jgi:hypothetical protein
LRDNSEFAAAGGVDGSAGTKEREEELVCDCDCGTRREVACDLTLRRKEKGERRVVVVVVVVVLLVGGRGESIGMEGANVVEGDV